MADISILTILAFSALGLMIAVTGGVAYLTAAEWRDRRRREREAKEQRPRTTPRTAAKPRRR